MHVRGTITAIDASSVEHPEENGELALRIENDDERRDYVAVRNGRFELDVAPDSRFSVDMAILGGRAAYVSNEGFSVRETIALRATWVTPTVVHVVDADTGVDLAGVTVKALPDWASPDTEGSLPASWDHTCVEDGVSPLALPVGKPPGWQQSLWFTARGYAWGLLTVDYLHGTERRLELQRAGTLEIRIEGRLPDKKPPRIDERFAFPIEQQGPQLRLYRPPAHTRLDANMMAMLRALRPAGSSDGGDEQDRARMLASLESDHRGDVIHESDARLDDPTVIDGLAPGEYLVAVEMGDWSKPLVLGEAKCTVAIDRTEHVDLHVELPPERATVPVSGTLFVPPAWGEIHFGLDFSPFDVVGGSSDQSTWIDPSKMTAAPATPRLHRWDAGALLPGRYRVKCFDVAYECIVDIGEHGTDRVQIVVPEPVDVSARVLEDATDRWLEDAEVSWIPNPHATFWSRPAKWNAETRRYEFRVGAGSVELEIGGHDYRITGESSFDVRPSDRELVLHVRRTCGVIVFLKRGDTAIPWDEVSVFKLHLETPDGKRVDRVSESFADHGHLLTTTEPGPYRILVPDQPGFAPVAPIEIEIPTGRFIEHDVQLQPRR